MSALRLALGFTVVLNLAVVTTFLWPWRFPTMLTVLLWAAVAGIWAVCFCGTWRRFPEPPTEKATIYEDLFLRAQAEYLRGEHFAAEAALDRLLRRRPQDIEARLLLASVYRRTDRAEEARKQLRRLSRTAGPKWALEVSREMQFLDQQPETQSSIDERASSPSAPSSEPITIAESAVDQVDQPANDAQPNATDVEAAITDIANETDVATEVDENHIPNQVTETHNNPQPTTDPADDFDGDLTKAA